MYLACFSSEPDVLSQWRAYADDGSGFAVGIDAASVPQSSDAGSCAGPLLVPIVYDDARKRDAVMDLLKLIRDALPELRVDRELAGTAINTILACTLAFKPYAYREECEWRLVWTGPHGPGVRPLASARAQGWRSEQLETPVDNAHVHEPA